MENSAYVEDPEIPAQPQVHDRTSVDVKPGNSFSPNKPEKKSRCNGTRWLIAVLFLFACLALAGFIVALVQLLQKIDESPGGWDGWQSWSSCGVVCEKATRTRIRQCNNGKAKESSNECPGVNFETQACTNAICNKGLLIGEECKLSNNNRCKDLNAECKVTGTGSEETCACKVGFVEKTFHGRRICSETSTASTKVLILGGGMTGVVAAKTLHDANEKDFIVVEAQGRLGGRMNNYIWAEGGGYSIELGAGWVHGLGKNPVWKLVQKFNMNGSITDYDDYTGRDDNGNDVTAQIDEAYKVLEPAAKYEESLHKSLTKSNGRDVNKEVGLRLGGFVVDSIYAAAAQYYDYEYEFGVPTRVTSVKYGNLARNTEFTSDDYRVQDPRGFRHTVQGLADEMTLTPGGKQLKLNSIVTRIETHGDKITVTLKSGEKIDAAYAINTFSIGVQQSKDIEYIPSLTGAKIKAQNSYGMAPYTKIFLKFPNQFWDNTEFIIHTPKRNGYFTIWENLNHPKVYPGSNIIYATVTSPESERIEALTDAEIQSEAVAVLRQMYPNATVPEPDAIFVPRWLHNKYTHGAYSNWPVGFEMDDYEQLTAPVGYMYFAGEALDPDFWGETSAAYLSGERTAKRILKCMQQKC